MFKFQLIENDKWETIQLFQEIRDGIYYGQELYPLQSWRLIGLNYCYYSPWVGYNKAQWGKSELKSKINWRRGF